MGKRRSNTPNTEGKSPASQLDLRPASVGDTGDIAVTFGGGCVDVLAPIPSHPTVEYLPRPLDLARETVQQGLDAIAECMGDVRDRLRACRGGKYDSHLASHMAFLTEKAAGIMDSLRLYERHEKDAVKAMTPGEKDALVKQYLADLPPARREEFRRLLDELDGQELLLG